MFQAKSALEAGLVGQFQCHVLVIVQNRDVDRELILSHGIIFP